MKKILGTEKKKKRKIADSDEDDDGFHNNAHALSDSDDDSPRRSKRGKTDVPKKSKVPRRGGDKELTVPKKEVPKKPKVDESKEASTKKTSSLLANMKGPTGPPPFVKRHEMDMKKPVYKNNKDSSATNKDGPSRPAVKKLMPGMEPDATLTSPSKRPPRGTNMAPNKVESKLEPFPTVSNPHPVVSNKPQPEHSKLKMTPRGRVMMTTLERLCNKLNDHTHFQLLLRGNLPASTQIDLGGSFSRDEEQAYDFFNHTENGDIILPPKIAIFPEEFPPGYKEHSLHWWGIVDPAVGARKSNNNSAAADAAPETNPKSSSRGDD